MAEVLLFRHAQGRTDGFEAFADALRRDGHTVHTPDLLDGRTFASIDEGMAYASEIGWSARVTSTPPASWSRRRTRPSSSSTPAISTTSPTRACRRTPPRAATLLTERVLAFLRAR